MEITFDPAKRDRTLRERGLDFADAEKVFEVAEFTWVDDRRDYGELRYNTLGLLDDRLIALTWTVRQAKRRIISMRRANDRERAFFNRALD